MSSSAQLPHVLEGRGLQRVSRAGDGWIARCPAHKDGNPSLSIKVGRDGRILFNCFAGCEAGAVAGALGLTMADLFPQKLNGKGRHLEGPPPHPVLVTTYDYVDENGEVLYAVRRYEPKDFRQGRVDADGRWTSGLGDVRRVLYHLPLVLEAIAEERRIYLVEGEKDVEALLELGLVATTCPMGAGKWREEYSESLRSAHVVIVPDNDESGRNHATKVADALRRIAASVSIVELPGVPEKGDVSDWLAAGGTREQLEALQPSPQRDRLARLTLRELLADPELLRPPAELAPFLAWRGRSTLLSGLPKLGKSTLTGQLGARVTDGGLFLGESCERGTVLIISLEEFIGDLVRRLYAFGADQDSVHVVQVLSYTPSEQPAALRRHVEELRPALLVLDTLPAYSVGLVKDPNQPTELTPLVQGLTNLAHDCDVAALILHHANRGSGSYRGSGAIGASVDVVAEMFGPEHVEKLGENDRLLRVKGRVPTRNVQIRWTGNEYEQPQRLTGQLNDLQQRVYDVICATEGISHTHLRRVSLARAKAVDEAVAKLLELGKIVDVGSETRHSYRLPVMSSAEGEPDSEKLSPDLAFRPDRPGTGHQAADIAPCPRGTGPGQGTDRVRDRPDEPAAGLPAARRRSRRGPAGRDPEQAAPLQLVTEP